MAEITFTITKITGKTAEGTLAWPNKNLSSNAVSGPAGKGYLPAGVYKAPRNKMLDKPSGSPYCDGNGKCWMQPIDPTFSTDRDNLGIHPDGGSSGTEGCIGIKDKDTAAWYKAFYDVKAGSSTDIEVIYSAKTILDSFMASHDLSQDVEVEKAIKAAGNEAKIILDSFLEKMGIEKNSGKETVKLFPNGIGYIKISVKATANISLDFEAADVNYKKNVDHSENKNNGL